MSAFLHNHNGTWKIVVEILRRLNYLSKWWETIYRIEVRFESFLYCTCYYYHHLRNLNDNVLWDHIPHEEDMELRYYIHIFKVSMYFIDQSIVSIKIIASYSCSSLTHSNQEWSKWYPINVKYKRMKGMANSASKIDSCWVSCKPFHNGLLNCFISMSIKNIFLKASTCR